MEDVLTMSALMSVKLKQANGVRPLSERDVFRQDRNPNIHSALV